MACGCFAIAVNNIYGLFVGKSNQSVRSSSRITGARGRNHSLFLMKKFMSSRLWKFLGSAKIDRLPSALGPYSDLPLNQATILPFDISLAIKLQSGSTTVRSGPR